jgi:hypothetical protein
MRGSLRRGCVSCPFAKTIHRRAPAMSPELLRITVDMAGAYERDLC